MRLIVNVAIATAYFPVACLLAMQQLAKAATPTEDVVVEIKLIPPYTPRLPAVIPQHLESPTSQDRFPSFNSEQLDRQLQRYNAYIEQNGVPDVLILGSSRALQGVNPFILQQSLEQQGYEGLRVFNFGINGATAQVVDWVLHNVFPPDQLPRLLIWADGSRAFNNGRIDHTFNKIIASEGNRQVRIGKRPIAKISAGLKLGQVCMDVLPVELTPLPSLPHQPSPAKFLPPGSSQPASNVQCKQPIKLILHHTSFNSPPVASKPLESFGFQPISNQFSPDRYFQRYPRVPGNYDADYRNFTLTGDQINAFVNVSRFANTHQIPLVFVNLPLTSTYLDAARSFREEQFRERMQRLAQTKRFTFIDFSSVYSLTRNSYFADPSHLNQFGAIAVAQELGKELGRLKFPLFPKLGRRSDQSFKLDQHLSLSTLILRVSTSDR